MAVFTAERTARKCRTCARCGKPIKPGQRYTLIAVTPHDPEVGNGASWWRAAEHSPLIICYRNVTEEGN